MRIAEFTLDPRQIASVGRGLSRPENVLAFRDGTVYASSNRGYISRIRPDGGQDEIYRLPAGEPTTMALESDTTLLVNNTADGNVYRLHVDGRSECVLSEIEGVALGSANYVYLDSRGRVWVAVATRRRPPHDRVHIEPDGYIVLIDGTGARIVADDLYWPNEIRLDADETHAYIPETFGRRVLRYEVAPNGTLINGHTFGPDRLGETSAPDGIAIDDQGNVWVAIVTRNGLTVITPDGRDQVIFEDPNVEATSRWLGHYRRGVVPMAAVRDCAGSVLQLPTSVGFGGPDLRTVFMGSLAMPHLLTFRSPTAGLPMAHQNRPGPPPAPSLTQRAEPDDRNAAETM